MVNRIAVVVRPGLPYVEWALSLDDSGVAPSASSATVYLVEVEDDDDVLSIQAALATEWEEIFERELDAWCTDPEAWPRDRTIGMLQRWFRIEIIDVIHDVGMTDIVDDE